MTSIAKHPVSAVKGKERGRVRDSGLLNPRIWEAGRRASAVLSNTHVEVVQGASLKRGQSLTSRKQKKG